MSWILWLMIIQLVGSAIIEFLRLPSFMAYVKSQGYTMVKRSSLEKIFGTILSYLRMLIPFYGALIFIALLFISDKALFEEGRKMGRIVKK